MLHWFVNREVCERVTRGGDLIEEDEVECPVYAKAYSAIRKRKYYASASLIVMAKSRARGIRMYACCGL